MVPGKLRQLPKAPLDPGAAATEAVNLRAVLPQQEEHTMRSPAPPQLESRPCSQLESLQRNKTGTAKNK